MSKGRSSSASLRVASPPPHNKYLPRRRSSLTPPLSLASSRHTSIMESFGPTTPGTSLAPSLEPAYPLLATINVIREREPVMIESSAIFSDASSLAKLLRFQSPPQDQKLNILQRVGLSSRSPDSASPASFHALLHGETLVLYSGLITDPAAVSSSTRVSSRLIKSTQPNLFNATDHTCIISYTAHGAPFLIHFPAHATTHSLDLPHGLPVTPRSRQLAQSKVDCRSTPFDPVPHSTLVHATASDPVSKAEALEEIAFSRVTQLLELSSSGTPQLHNADGRSETAVAAVMPLLRELRTTLRTLERCRVYGVRVVVGRDDLALYDATAEVASIRAELERSARSWPVPVRQLSPTPFTEDEDAEEGD